MPLRTWNGSSWITAPSLRVWNGSSWVNAKSGKVWNGSSWVNFLSSVNITNQSFGGSAGGLEDANAGASYTLGSDGVAVGFEDNGNFTSTFPISGEWFVGGSISDFSVRATLVSFTDSGSGSYNGTFGSWLALTTSRTWEVFTNALGEGDFQEAELVFTIDIAYTVDTSKIIDTATITLGADAQTA
jgi:hypothetical protein